MISPNDDRDSVMHRQVDLIDAALRQVESAHSTVSGGGAQRGKTQSIGGNPHESVLSIRDLSGYRIESEVHRGGQGIVYRATQESTGKAVAIKVILGGPLAGPQQSARFHREIRILAKLRHPHIVTIHDSGFVGGVAYYVMDFIEGRRLDKFVRDEALTTEQKLELLTQVFDAVHAAHLHGVIHRDLKPGNILVDDQGNPRVLDFGLAKSVGDADDTHADMTQTGQFVGSLPWASPEQVSALVGGVDLRTDVYSLGVILFQLLTDTFPYSVTGPTHDVIQRIVSKEPRNPTCNGRRLDSDLVTIVMKALQKDRELRYQSAGALADDVRRFLAGDPIDAQRTSILYLLRKRLAQHKWLAAFATTTLFTVLVGIIVALLLWRVASRQAVEAQQHAKRAETVRQFLADTLASANVSTGGKADLTVRSAIDESVRKLNQRSFQDEPEVESNLRMVIGRTYSSLGLFAEAHEQLALARKLAQHPSGSETDESLEAWVELVDVLRQGGRTDEAEQNLAECLPAVRTQHGESHLLTAQIMSVQAAMARDRGDYELAVSTSRKAEQIAVSVHAPTEARALFLNELGLSLDLQGQTSEAIQTLEVALDLFQQSLGPSHFRTAVCMYNIAGLRVRTRDYSEAERLYEQALQVFRTAGGERNLQVAETLNSMGQLYAARKEFARALEIHREALDIRRDALPADHVLIANSLNNLALCQFELGNFSSAEESFDQALAIHVAAHGDQHLGIATLINNIAGIAAMNGQLTKASENFRRSLEIRLKHLPQDHPDVAKVRHNLGRVLLNLGELEESESELRTALGIRTDALGPHHPDTASTKDALASLLREQGHLEEAERICREALADRKESLGADTLELADSLSNLAAILVEQDSAEEALPLAEEAERIVTRLLPEDHWRIAIFTIAVADALVKLERFEEAAPKLESAYETLHQMFGSMDYRAMKTQRKLESLYEAWGKPEQAARWRGPNPTGAFP